LNRELSDSYMNMGITMLRIIDHLR